MDLLVGDQMDIQTTNKHPENIEGWNGTFEELANAVGNLKYNRLHQFLTCLCLKLYKDYNNDEKNGKNKLSKRLKEAYWLMDKAKYEIYQAWLICESHENKTQDRVTTNKK
jgi:hypothetical protein